MSYFNMTIGADIKLSKTGDLSVGANGDIELVKNEANVMQSVRMSVLTNLKNYEYDQGYGSTLHLFKSLPNTSRIRMVAAAEVAEAVRRNAKIKNVVKVVTKKDGDTSYSIECLVIPIDHDRIYNVVFPVRA